jgi:4-amino-4-deoxy-L-arabinose transferase-like glycosyltransferase
MNRRDWLLLLLIIAAGAVLRFWQLGVVPPGPQFDEAFNAIDAEQIIQGNRPLFLPANGGREALFSYVQAAVGALFGLNLFTLRLTPAIFGVLTIPALFWLVRTLFRRDGAPNTPLALWVAAALAVNYWHIHFSHYGIRIITMPLLTTLLFGSFWLALHSPQPSTRRWAVIATGLLTGLGPWVNPTGRFAPFILLFYAAWLLWRYPARRRWRWDEPVGVLAITGLLAFVVFLPLGLEFLRHPEWFLGHASEVSVFAERVAGERSSLALLGDNVLRVLGMFSFDGDLEWAHGIPDRPVFDWFMALPFYVGVVIWSSGLLDRPRQEEAAAGHFAGHFAGRRRDALWLLFVWAAVMLAPSILSEAAPNYSRTLAAVPPVAFAAGLGLDWLVRRLSAGFPAAKERPAANTVQPMAAGAGVLLLVVGAVSTGYDYFVRYPAMPEVYYAYDADKVDAVNWLLAEAEANAIYLSPLWTEHARVNFLRSRAIRSLDIRNTVVLPAPGKGAVAAFPAEQADFAEDYAAHWDDLAVETVPDAQGRPLLSVVRLDAETGAQWPPELAPALVTEARFDDGPTLLGMRPAADGHSLSLYWRSEAPTYRNLTAFVHLLDRRNQRIGQADVIPGDGVFQTPDWEVGERVIEQVTPVIDDRCAGGETVRVVTGWYEYQADGARRPRSDGPGDVALAGEMTLPVRSAPPADFALADAASVAMGDELALLGWQGPLQVEAGAPFAVESFWQGDGRHGATPVTITLTGDAIAPLPLYAGPLATDAQWSDGEAICRRSWIRTPAGLPPGDYRLLVAAGAGTPVGVDLAVTASTRLFAAPAGATGVNATLGDAIQLTGYSVTTTADSLVVTLIWQALGIPAASEKVFVHLVDGDGALVAQSDALPAAGYTTDRWIAGEYVVDIHTLALPAVPAATGNWGERVQLRTGMYDPITGDRLPVFDGAGNPVPDGVVTLPLP